jgi:glycosyltransferase involved in cell wall biosynthesis
MSIFARQNKVLYVENHTDVYEASAKIRRGQFGLGRLREPLLRQEDDNLYIFRYPAWAPVLGRFDGMTAKLRAAALQRALQQLDMAQPIVWFSRPNMLKRFNEIPSARLSLYHVVDEYTAYRAHTPTKRQRLARREQKLMKQVDAVVVVSQQLYAAKKPFNPNTFLVPNGVNYEAYSQALAEAALPKDLQAIKPPRIGYIGLIGDKLDFKLLLQVAQQQVDWSFVFLGEARVTLQAELWQSLTALPNVHHLKAVDVTVVPHYVKGFQVGLMPYLQDDHAENISPLKLYDYLAAGIPVASVDIPAVRAFEDCISLAAGPADFLAAIQAALADTTPARMETRRAVAARHTWEARVEQLSEIIETCLRQKLSTSQILITSPGR